MKKIITSLLLGMALLAMGVSCSNNASETETNGASNSSGTNNANVAVFSDTVNEGGVIVTYRVKVYANNTWELEAECKSQKVVEMKGNHNIDLTKDGAYQLTMTHCQKGYLDTTYEPADPSTWAELVIAGTVGSTPIDVELKDSGKTLVISKTAATYIRE